MGSTHSSLVGCLLKCDLWTTFLYERSAMTDGTSTCRRSEQSTRPGWWSRGARVRRGTVQSACLVAPRTRGQGHLAQVRVPRARTAFGHAALPLNSSTSALAGSWTRVMPRLTVVTPMGPAQGDTANVQAMGHAHAHRAPKYNRSAKVHRGGKGWCGVFSR